MNQLSHPAVTICNIDVNQYSRFSKTNGPHEFIPKEQKNVSLQDKILSCSFNQRDCQLTEDFRVDNRIGSCFTFNFNDSIVRLHPSPGPQYGLRLLLNTEESSGVRIVVHEQNVMPLPEQFGNNAAAGFVTSFRVKSKFIRRTKRPHGVCRDLPLHYMVLKYSQEGCYIDCLQQHVLHTCGCSNPQYPAGYIMSSSEECDPTKQEEWKCMKELFAKRAAYFYEDCQCAPACSETVYEMSSSSAVLPPNLSICTGTDMNNCTQQPSSSTALVEVFTEQHHFEELREKAVYPFPRLMFDLIRNLIVCILIVLVALVLPSRTKKMETREDGEERSPLNKD